MPPPVSPPLPLVSVVIIGRNDGYMGDYLYRLGTSLAFLARSAERAGLLDEMEVLVVDWASEQPLSGALTLTAAAHRVTRFLTITPDMMRASDEAGRWRPTRA